MYKLYKIKNKYLYIYIYIKGLSSQNLRPGYKLQISHTNLLKLFSPDTQKQLSFTMLEKYFTLSKIAVDDDIIINSKISVISLFY